MRITLHAVTAADYPPFHRAMAESLRAARLSDRSTAALRTGGKNSRPPRSASCLAKVQRSWPAALRSSNSSWSTGGTRVRSA
jgi:hypothetical protein